MCDNTNMKTSSPDFNFTNHGSIVMVTPLTDAAREFVEDKVVLEDWNCWAGGGFAVEHRFAADLVSGIEAEGLVIA